MQLPSKQREFQVTLQLPKEMTKTVMVKASNRETAERRALKRNPGALHVKRGQ